MEGSTFVAQCRAYKFWLESYLNISAQYRCLPILLVSARLSPERLTAKKTMGANFEKKKKVQVDETYTSIITSSTKLELVPLVQFSFWH